MFLLGVDWPAAMDAFALSAAACLGASYVGYLALDALDRLTGGPTENPSTEAPRMELGS